VSDIRIKKSVVNLYGEHGTCLAQLALTQHSHAHANIEIYGLVDVELWDNLAPKIREALVMMGLGDSEK